MEMEGTDYLSVVNFHFPKSENGISCNRLLSISIEAHRSF